MTAEVDRFIIVFVYLLTVVKLLKDKHVVSLLVGYRIRNKITTFGISNYIYQLIDARG